jgi:hypothetical protein
MLLGFSWRDEPATPYEPYVALREVRQACYAACMQLWVAWLKRTNVSRRIISDIDLQVLIECSVSLILKPVEAKAVLHDARTLVRKYGFMPGVLLANGTQLKFGQWQAVHESLLFPVGVMLLDYAGYNKTYLLSLHPNVVFGTCVGQDVVELLRQSFSDEDQEVLVPVDQLPSRVRSGVRKRSLGVMNFDSALALMLQGEKTTW